MNTKGVKKVRMGRPPLPKGHARGIVAKLKLNKTESEVIEKASEAAGLDKSKWMRKTLLEAAVA